MKKPASSEDIEVDSIERPLPAGLHFSEIPHAKTRSLRGVLIVPGSTDGVLHMPEDDVESSAHWGVYHQHDLIAVVSLVPQVAPAMEPSSMLRFYALAVSPPWHQLGVGTAIVNRLMQTAGQVGATILWAKARPASHGSFLKSGFTIVAQGVLNPATGMKSHVAWRGISPKNVNGS